MLREHDLIKVSRILSLPPCPNIKSHIFAYLVGNYQSTICQLTERQFFSSPACILGQKKPLVIVWPFPSPSLRIRFTFLASLPSLSVIGSCFFWFPSRLLWPPRCVVLRRGPARLRRGNKSSDLLGTMEANAPAPRMHHNTTRPPTPGATWHSTCVCLFEWMVVRFKRSA